MYPVVTHWAWSPQGWLGQGVDINYDNETVTIPYRDFAGSGVVHLLGGTAALVRIPWKTVSSRGVFQSASFATQNSSGCFSSSSGCCFRWARRFWGRASAASTRAKRASESTSRATPYRSLRWEHSSSSLAFSPSTEVLRFSCHCFIRTFVLVRLSSGGNQTTSAAVVCLSHVTCVYCRRVSRSRGTARRWRSPSLTLSYRRPSAP